MKFFENEIGGPGDTQARGRATSGDLKNGVYQNLNLRIFFKIFSYLQTFPETSLV